MATIIAVVVLEVLGLISRICGNARAPGISRKVLAQLLRHVSRQRYHIPNWVFRMRSAVTCDVTSAA